MRNSEEIKEQIEELEVEYREARNRETVKLLKKAPEGEIAVLVEEVKREGRFLSETKMSLYLKWFGEYYKIPVRVTGIRSEYPYIDMRTPGKKPGLSTLEFTAYENNLEIFTSKEDEA